jgi:hypothetical protein
MQKDYSEHIIGKTIIDHKERIFLGLTNDEYVLRLIIRPDKTYADYWKEAGFYPSEVRKLIGQLKAKKMLHVSQVNSSDPLTKKSIKSKKIPFEESDIYDKKLFAAKFNKWNKEKLAYYWNAADSWSEEGGRKVNWYKTILNWATRDEKEGRLKFKEEVQEEKTNFFNNR